MRSAYLSMMGAVCTTWLLLWATNPINACHGTTSSTTGNRYDNLPLGDDTGGNRCSDLVLFPVGSVDPADQYRFDYSDVGFGTTHQSGATVTVTCTSNGQSGSVYAFDPSRTAISSGSQVVASCQPVGSRQAWTVSGRVLQFVDCRKF